MFMSAIPEATLTQKRSEFNEGTGDLFRGQVVKLKLSYAGTVYELPTSRQVVELCCGGRVATLVCAFREGTHADIVASAVRCREQAFYQR